MNFAPEPAYRHGQPERSAVLLVNLGTPDAPTPAALRRYLAEFLWDPRVVEIPRPLWWLILHGVILRLRPAKSAAKYASIWAADGSPLLLGTRGQAEGLQALLDARGHTVLVRFAMRYGQPAIAAELDALKAAGATRILVLPLYPQYAAATTGSVVDAVGAWARRSRRVPELRFVNHYHDDPAHIAALAASVREHWAAHGRGQKLVMSFHGVPARSLALGDPYHCECHVTARLLAQALGLSADGYIVTFQSRLGRAQWLEPYTEPTVQRLAREGIRQLDAICPGFATDNLETLEEVGMEVRDAFLAAGGERFAYIPCLNTRADGLAALADLAERHLQGWPTRSDSGPTGEALAAQRQRALAQGASD
ncbi:ferrochelatase [Aquabacterium sp. OR-4]|uniref:ferrochelatase n=1 Tax=Aquabacterium sp. OR-4 TaxID=2978127 RepID=UPI0028C7112F|nr:ferrochelatase [Aquabacterium sp. OR-4]MDT7835414.1 ferrochelatase [Aquabacterium sp. OR-4]